MVRYPDPRLSGPAVSEGTSHQWLHVVASCPVSGKFCCLGWRIEKNCVGDLFLRSSPQNLCWLAL